jgi:hypothetical protein
MSDTAETRRRPSAYVIAVGVGVAVVGVILMISGYVAQSLGIIGWSWPVLLAGLAVAVVGVVMRVFRV